MIYSNLNQQRKYIASTQEVLQMKSFRSIVSLGAALVCLTTAAPAIEYIVQGETLTCETAKAYAVDDAKLLTLTPSEQDLAMGKRRLCVAELWNEANPDNTQVVFATQSAAPEGQAPRYFFETIAQNDFEHLHEACVITGVASGSILTGTYIADVGQAGYFEWASQVGCSGLMKGLSQDNIFVVTAPVTMFHLALAKDILKKNGGLLGEINTFSEKVEAEYKRVADKAKEESSRVAEQAAAEAKRGLDKLEDVGQGAINIVRGCCKF